MGKIYLLETNLYTNELERVYKLGRSDQTGLKRFTGYAKEYEIIILIECKNSIHTETELIKLFKQKYSLYINNEYFVGDKQSMIKDIVELVSIPNQPVEPKVSILDEFLEKYEITNDPNDFTQSKEIARIMEMPDLTKWGRAINQYCKTNQYTNVESKAKKINGKTLHVWLGIKGKVKQISGTFASKADLLIGIDPYAPISR